MPKDTSRIIQRHFPPLTSRSAFRSELRSNGPKLSSRITYPLVECSPPVEDPKPEEQVVIIPKPAGEVSRIKRNGYNLEHTLNWPKGDYAKVQKSMRVLAKAHLDMGEIKAKQKAKNLKKVYKLAKEQFPILEKYEKDWVIDDFLGMILKNSSGRQKRKVEKKTGEAGEKKDTEDESDSESEDTKE